MKIKINNNLSFKSEGPPLLIAEISANHCGSKNSFLKHILYAKKSGADLVKIQSYETIDMTINNKFVIKSGTWKGLNISNLYKKAQTPFDWHYDAFELAKKKKICLFSTPFSIRALNFLKNFNPPLYKVASFEITDHNLITEIAKMNKPIIISSGLAKLNEIKEAIKIIKKFHNKIVLLHCISAYPTPEEDINLNQIKFLKENLKINFVGLSDHTKDIKTASLSSVLGISAIEKHFILKKNKKSPDNSFSITPKEFSLLKKNLISYNKIFGENKIIRPKSEKSNYIFRRSIYATKFIKKGDILSKENIGCFRPNLGLGAEMYLKVLGKKAKKNIRKFLPLRKNLIQ